MSRKLERIFTMTYLRALGCSLKAFIDPESAVAAVKH